MFKYSKKFIVAGNIIESYFYSKPRFCGLTQFEKKSVISQGDSKRSVQTNQRASGNIRALVNSNPQLNKFLTLTYAENLKDLTKSNLYFKNFVKRMKYRFPDFQYICIVEFQKRGAIHYHLVCNLPYYKKENIAKIWQKGFIKIKRVVNVRNLGAYFAKHSFKNDKIESENLAGRKKFFTSRNLFRPYVIMVPEEVLSFEQKFLRTIQPFFEKVFTTSDLTIYYKQYKI